MEKLEVWREGIVICRFCPTVKVSLLRKVGARQEEISSSVHEG